MQFISGTVRTSAAIIFICAALWGCRGVETYDGRNDDMGEVTFAIADSPIEKADEVLVSVQSLDFYPDDGSDPITIAVEDGINPIDLLQFTDGASEKLFDRSRLPVGKYNQIKINLLEGATSTISFEGDDSRFDLIPSASIDADLTLAYVFSVKEDSDLYFTIDIDLGLSVTEDPAIADTYHFSPHLRVVDTDDAATITGQVATSLFGVDSDCDTVTGELDEGNVVYLFRDGASVRDIRGAVGDPMATAQVDALTGIYTIPFLAADTYTLVFTCDGELDKPNEDNFTQMEFSDTETEELKKAEVKTVNFSS